MAPKINSIKILVFALLINGFLGLLLLLDEGPVRVDLNEQHCPEYVCEGWWWSPKPRVKEQIQAPTKIPTELKDVTNHETSTDLAMFENTPPVDSPPANASLADGPTVVTPSRACPATGSGKIQNHTAAQGCLGLISPTACFSLAFIIYLPSVVLEGIAIAQARGRV